MYRFYKIPLIISSAKRRLSFAAFAVLVIMVCIYLGQWQLMRADEKQQLLNAPTTYLTHPNKLTINNVHKRIAISGYFDNQYPILLDNQIYNKQLGYHLYLPFISKEKAVLVNLGWIKSPQSRSSLPPIQQFKGLYEIKGTLSKEQGSPILLGDNMTFKEDVLLVQKTIISDIQGKLPYLIQPVLIQLDKDSNVGFIKNWQITVMSPEKHTAYAVQWFLLAIFIFLISIAWFKHHHSSTQE